MGRDHGQGSLRARRPPGEALKLPLQQGVLPGRLPRLRRSTEPRRRQDRRRAGPGTQKRAGTRREIVGQGQRLARLPRWRGLRRMARPLRHQTPVLRGWGAGSGFKRVECDHDVARRLAFQAVGELPRWPLLCRVASEAPRSRHPGSHLRGRSKAPSKLLGVRRALVQSLPSDNRRR